MLEKLEQSIAKRIINSLEDGIPSIEDIHYFSSSSHPLNSVIESDLEDISCGSYGKVKFLNGSYGEGKTHFLGWIRKKAIDDNFVVSMFAISPRGIAFDMMERAFGEMIKKMGVKGYKTTGDKTVVEYILSKWIKGVSNPERELRNMDLNKDLRSVFIHLIKYIPQKNLYYRERDILNGWLRGDTHPIGELKKEFGIYNHINPRNTVEIWRSFGKFFKKIGYKGWIILIDEQEIISTLLTARKYKLTSQNLRLMIDQQSNIDGIYILFATTDEFFSAIPEVYPALRTRITSANTLDLPHIEKEAMEEIGNKVKRICEIAWKTSIELTPIQINQCVKVAVERPIPSARARTYVKSLIKLMVELRESRTRDPVLTFTKIYPATSLEVATEKDRAKQGM